ncbi:MAG: hypothetical protein ACRERE_34835 [Candidatus Entotheonellia bacterium]
MQNIVRSLVLLVVIGLAMAPAFAAELRVTGFFDNVFPHWDSNTSSVDNDQTRNSDQIFFGRNRSRFFFNFIASDDLRGVLGLEIDQAYGAPQNDRFGSGCVEEEGTFGAEQCGFRNAIDTNSIEVKHLYVDFRVPQLPFGNRWRIGGFRFQALPLHSSTVYNIDGGGGDLRLNFTDQVSLLLSYQQLEEDLDRFPGSAKLGEDYVAAATLMLKPIEGLDFHLLGIYTHIQNPISLTGTGDPFAAIAQDARNVTTESRYYLGFDARYRIGNTSIEPTFVYVLGTRKFCTPGTLTNTLGTLIPCTSAASGRGSLDYGGFQGILEVFHTTGPWLFGGKFGYSSGNAADDDLNNRGIGNREDIGWRQVATESPRINDWFEIFGTSDVDGTGTRVFRRGAESEHLDRFGWVVLGGKAEYKATDRLILEGAVGGFWTAEKTGCPANFRLGSLSGPCTGPNSPRNSSGEPALNFTGNSRFMGWEIDAGLRYTIMPGLTWTPRIGYADYGDAFSANNRKATDAWIVVNRMIYIF